MKQEYLKNKVETLKQCPWCRCKQYKVWGAPMDFFRTVECKDCKLVYVKKRLNEKGLHRLYQNYLTNVHVSDVQIVKKRKKMYELEYDFVQKYVKGKAVLDVGCSRGDFLSVFLKRGGYVCTGVEFGEEAVQVAQRKFKVYFGNFVNMVIRKKFDLVIFRGVIEHIPYPKEYLLKAISVLKQAGCIYITSTPNADSFCANLFKEQWNQHSPEAHLMHFRPHHFDKFFTSYNFKKVAEHYFYEKTPYADVQKDIMKVSKAIAFKKQKKKIPFKSPAFWGTMLSIVYRGNG